MHPLDGFAGNSKPGIWREVSVDGGIYALRESRSTPQKSSVVSSVICCISLHSCVALCCLFIICDKVDARHDYQHHGDHFAGNLEM